MESEEQFTARVNLKTNRFPNYNSRFETSILQLYTPLTNHQIKHLLTNHQIKLQNNFETLEIQRIVCDKKFYALSIENFNLKNLNT